MSSWRYYSVRGFLWHFQIYRNNFISCMCLKEHNFYPYESLIFLLFHLPMLTNNWIKKELYKTWVVITRLLSKNRITFILLMVEKPQCDVCDHWYGTLRDFRINNIKIILANACSSDNNKINTHICNFFGLDLKCKKI